MNLASLSSFIFSVSLLALIMTASVLFVILLLVRRMNNLRAEAARLNNAVRILLRGGATPAGLSFQEPVLRDLWRMTLSTMTSRRHEDSAEDAYREVIELTKDLASTLDGRNTTADAVLGLMLRQGAPELRAGAVVRFCPESATGKIEAISGVHDRRLQRLLSEYTEELRLNPRLSKTGYIIPAKNTPWDLTTFGIGMSYLAPLGEDGFLWLGLGVSAHSLSAKKQWLIQCLAEHGSASLEAADRLHEQATRGLREREFLLGISHDLRAPGHSALYALSAVQEEVNPEVQQSLRLAEEAIKEQLQLVSDFLDLSRHEKGYLEARKERVQLYDLLHPIVDMMKSSTILTLAVEIPRSVAVSFDIQHLKRIVTNFLSNGIKFTENGSVTLSAKIVGDIVEISVEDSGPGIPKEEQSLLFRPFERLTNSGESAGFGLGLSLVKVLAELNGGYVFYRTSTTGGSIFGLGAPLAELGSEDGTRTNDLKPCTSLKIGPLGRILLLDDDHAALRTTKRHLGGSASEILTASTLDDAFLTIAKVSPDLIITDFRIGDRTAEELFQRLETEQSSTPVIVLTGMTELPNLDFGDRQIQLLTKPASRQELLDAALRFRPN